MKTGNKLSREQQIKKKAVTSAAISVVTMAACINAFAETAPQSAAVPEATLSMCATIAFRNKNVNVCNDLERKAKPLPSIQGSSAPTGSVPSTSPNYGKGVK